ncbi:MAG: ParA family protein [Bdellovibrionales bacterium]
MLILFWCHCSVCARRFESAIEHGWTYKEEFESDLKIEGIVLTMFDKRNNLSHQVVTEIQSHFGDKVFKSIIPRNVRLSEAPSHGQSIFMITDPLAQKNI